MAQEIELAILATIYVVIIGAMLTPVMLALTRPIHPACKRLARRATWAACKAALVRWLTTIATAAAALSIAVTVTTMPVHAQSASATQQATAKSIERMIGVLDKAAKHPVAQIAKLVTRGYTVVKVYRLSKQMKDLKADVAALDAAVHAMLVEITGVIARVDRGEVVTAEQIAAVNERLDVHGVKIAAAEAEIEVLKARMDAAERAQRELAQRQRGTERKTDRPAKEPNTHFDPKSGRRIDAREKPEQGGLLGVRIEAR